MLTADRRPLEFPPPAQHHHDIAHLDGMLFADTGQPRRVPYSMADCASSWLEGYDYVANAQKETA